MVSLCSPGCSGTPSVDQAGFKLTEICQPVPVLVLKVCATTAQKGKRFKKSCVKQLRFAVTKCPRPTRLKKISPKQHKKINRRGKLIQVYNFGNLVRS